MPIQEQSLFPMNLREFGLFRTLVHRRTGIWIRDGKQVMLASRLSRRLRHHGMSDFVEYYKYVQTVPSDSEEMRQLINCVTTNKTSFFRERHHFDYLASTVVPEIKSAVTRGASRSIRVWSAASSTGEEAYSIAITLLEALKTVQIAGGVPHELSGPRTAGLPRFAMAADSPFASWKIEIVASDIDTAVLAAGQRGVYREDTLESIAPALRSKYFLRGKDDMRGHVKVKPGIARLVEFKRINLMDDRWPIEVRFDVIFFRNALIYFDQKTQDAFLRKMVRYLKPRGYLFLGNSEHIPWFHNIFAPLNQTMYRLRDGQD